MTESIMCDECEGWYHRKCAKLSPKVFTKLANSNKPYFCDSCKTSKYCKLCTKYCRVNQKSIKCDICSFYVHLKCTPFTDAQYARIKDLNEVYYCAQCIKESLPFGESPDTQELIPLVFDEPDNCTLCTECNTECTECDVCKNLHKMCTVCNNCMYHDYESLCETFAKKPEGGLTMMHFNTRSLTKNFSSFYDIISNLPSDPDIICISETKLNDYISGSDDFLEDSAPNYTSEIEIEIPDYTFICNNSKTSAGGSGIYVNNSLMHKNRPDLEPSIDGCEGSFIEINKGSNNKNILIASIYRHPHDNHDLFFEYLSGLLDKCANKFDICVMGDININVNPGCKTYKKIGKTYLDMISRFGLKNAINKPTRVVGVSETIIDHFLTNIPINRTNAGILVNRITDHFPIFATVDSRIEKSLRRPVYKRIISDRKKNNFS